MTVCSRWRFRGKASRTCRIFDTFAYFTPGTSSSKMLCLLFDLSFSSRTGYHLQKALQFTEKMTWFSHDVFSTTFIPHQFSAISLFSQQLALDPFQWQQSNVVLWSTFTAREPQTQSDSKVIAKWLSGVGQKMTPNRLKSDLKSDFWVILDTLEPLSRHFLANPRKGLFTFESFLNHFGCFGVWGYLAGNADHKFSWFCSVTKPWFTKLGF